MFSDENATAYQVIDNEQFPNYCSFFGWKVDNGSSFKEKYNCNSYDESLYYLQQVTDLDLLGSLIFSHWRYFNHCAYSSQEILDYKEWFVKALNRLKDIANNK